MRGIWKARHFQIRHRSDPESQAAAWPPNQRPWVFAGKIWKKQSRKAENRLGPEWAGRLGLGLPDTVTPQEIGYAIGSHGLAFFRSDDVWTLSSQVPAAVPTADCVVDLEHDMDPEEYDEHYTVTDMIRDKLDDAETDLANKAWVEKDQAVEDEY